MKTYQFIKNNNGEVVSVDHITAVSFDPEKTPYEMRVFTPATKYGVAFHYDTIEKMEKAAKNLNKILVVTKLRIIKFANWWIAANNVESISDCESCLRVRMEYGQSFDIVIEPKSEIEYCKKEIEKSLESMWSLKDLDADEDDDQ